MRKCPYCAEQIQDDAVLCPYCRSDLTIDPEVAMGPARSTEASASSPAVPAPASLPEVPSPAGGPSAAGGPEVPSATGAPDAPSPAGGPEGAVETGPRVGEGATRFSHSGDRYILGFGDGFFGIWDRTQPGAAIYTFPRTDQGWNEAWNRFSGMERRFVEVPHAGTPPDARVSTAGYQSMRTLGNWVVALLGLSALFALATLIARGVYISRLRGLEAGSVAVQHASAARDAVNGLAGFGLFSIAVTGVVWIVWQYRGHSNLEALGVADRRFTPGWMVAWWLIPFANFVMPARTTSELWRGSNPSGGAIDWKGARLTPLIPIWWTAWLLRVPLISLASAAAPRHGASPHQLISQQWLGMGVDAVHIIAAVFAILLVRQITDRLEQKRTRVAAYGSAVAATSR